MMRRSPRLGRRAGHALAAVLLLLGPFAALTTVVVLTTPGVFSLDADVASHLHRMVLDHPTLGSVLRVVGVITLPDTFRAIALVSAVLLWRRDRRRAAGWLVLTMTIGGVLGVVLKEVFTRSRPEWPDAITVSSGYSYPSGHALNSVLAAGCAIVLLHPVLKSTGRRLLWIAAVAIVVLVGFDRVALGVHYLTDVLAGWAVALVVIFTTLAAFGALTPPELDALNTEQPSIQNDHARADDHARTGGVSVPADDREAR